MKAQRLLVLGLIVLASVGVGFLSTNDTVGRLTGFQGLEQLTLAYRQQFVRQSFRADGGDQSEVALVLFDSTAVGGWPYLSPFPRAHLADIIQALRRAGARTIGLDVYLESLFPELNQVDAGDDRLRTALEEAGNVVLVAPTVESDSGHTLKRPHSAFADPAADVGAADFPTPFETVQDGLLAVRTDEGLEPSFALAVWAHYRDLDVDSLLRVTRESGRLPVQGMPRQVARIPEGWIDGGRGGGFAMPFPLRFYGPPSHPDDRDEEGTFPTYSSSYVETLAAFTPEFFRDKIVLLGTGFHDSDKFRTPYYNYPRPPDTTAARSTGEDEDIYGWMYGVEIHANAIQNFLDGTFIHRLGFGGKAFLMLLAAGLAGGVVFWKGVAWGGGATALSILGVLATAVWAFVGQVYVPGLSFDLGVSLLWVPTVAPVVAVLTSYLGSTAYVAVVEGKEKRFIRGAFGKYVPPAVVDEISESPDALKLGGEKRPLSIFFSDLAGFTTLSESMEPEDLIALLNEYLHEMTELVLEERGTLDKYIGDAIMAFWNAPQEQSDHADRALRCAIRTQHKMEELNRRWAEQGRNPEGFTVRIGVSTGDVVVGNVGGQDRFDYSAIGDAVNLAARLEPANKTYGTLTMASEFTIQRARGSYRLRELDLVAVKGKERPVEVYEVLGFGDEEFSPEKEEALEHFEAGLQAYRNRDWELAEKYFEAALESDPEDGPSQVYLERTREYASDPPPADWDFVVRRKVK